ncbi:hypothetical protein F2P81_023937 [Scophthalmus maximus]|uniref:Uncharacterized protein n=1 Tax=Scophthalmus maximus TaxID=52904 RepID=A0A6A4RSN4_SCOMX|nr:hypothetical protein F2P81_023937 [Scophthalmus maximus]
MEWRAKRAEEERKHPINTVTQTRRITTESQQQVNQKHVEMGSGLGEYDAGRIEMGHRIALKEQACENVTGCSRCSPSPPLAQLEMEGSNITLKSIKHLHQCVHCLCVSCISEKLKIKLPASEMQRHGRQ